MRSIVILAPHFPPSNLAGVHRARLLCQHFHEFGWRPIVVTTHCKHYEESLDWDLVSLIDPSLEVISTKAAPTRPIRLIGDIGVRALPWHLSALRKLRREGKMDFLLITVPSFFSAVLGQLLWKDSPLPFGIDYIDPWVNSWPDADKRFSKAWVSLKLAELLEPWAVRNASLITAVAPGYYSGVLERNPQLIKNAIIAAMPYGFSTADFTSSAVAHRNATMFDPSDGNLHFVYAGALLPKAHSVLERLLEGLLALRRINPEVGNRIRMHFIGTGKSPNDKLGYNVLPIARRLGLEHAVKEHPHRMQYLDVLCHLTKCYSPLIIGSTEAHYTPSKVFQSVQSRRPVFAMLHESSTAVEVLNSSRSGIALTITEKVLPTVDQVSEALSDIIKIKYDPNNVDWAAFEMYSARESTRVMAQAIDQALVRWTKA